MSFSEEEIEDKVYVENQDQSDNIGTTFASEYEESNKSLSLNSSDYNSDYD